MNGGITENVRKNLVNQISNTSIQERLFGSIKEILYGSENNCNCTIREWQNWTKCDLLVFAPCLPCNCKVLGPNIPAGGCYVLACGFCLNEKVRKMKIDLNGFFPSILLIF